MESLKASDYLDIQKSYLSENELRTKLHSYIDGSLLTEDFEFDFYSALHKKLIDGKKFDYVYHDLTTKNNDEKLRVSDNVIASKISFVSNLSKEQSLNLILKQKNDYKMKQAS